MQNKLFSPVFKVFDLFPCVSCDAWGGGGPLNGENELSAGCEDALNVTDFVNDEFAAAVVEFENFESMFFMCCL